MDVKKLVSDNASGILSLIACAGVVITGVLTFRAGVKAKETMSEWTEEKHDELTTFEKVQASAKHVIIPAIAGAATIGCIAKAHSIDQNIISQNKEKIAALAGLTAAATKKYDNYRKANIEVNGKDADDRVMKKLAVQEAKDSNITAESMWSMTCLNSKLSEEKFLFHDEISNQYFTSSLAHVLDAVNHLNRNFTMGHPEVDVQMWCDFLGIENKHKDTRGWVLCDDFQWIDFDISDPAQIEGGLEVITISTTTSPIPHYLDFDPLDNCYYDEDGNEYDIDQALKIEEILKDESVPF